MTRKLHNGASMLASNLPGRARCQWMSKELLRLQSQHELFANAAYCLVAGADRYTIEDALCSAETIQRQVGELAEQLAAMMVARELSRHAPQACT